MKLKQRPPVIILAALSAIFLVLYPLLSLFILRSHVEIFQQLGTSFQTKTVLLTVASGLGKAALILICVWLGVGVNALLMRIKDSAKRKRITIGFVFASTLLCVVLPALGLVFTYSSLSPKQSWQQLPAPPETAMGIAGGSYNLIIIETANQTYYSHSVPDDGESWQVEEQPSASMLPDMDGVISPSIQPPGAFISMIGVPTYPGSTQKIYYVLLEDHTVWYLDSQTGGAFFATAILATLFIPIMLGSLLMLFGMGAMSLLGWLTGLLWRESKIEK